jgi:uncharacterized protein (DUF302 family)
MRQVLWTVFLLVSSTAYSQEGLIVQDSQYSVQQTLDRLAEGVEERGLAVAARIDHGAGAAKAGLTLNDSQVLIFGNAKIGTPLMELTPTIALDLPLKVAAWRGADAKVHIGYLDPAVLAQRHGIRPDHPTIAKMGAALKALTRQAAGVTP